MSQLITVGTRGFNLTTLTHYAYDVVPTEMGENEMGCVLSFGCDDTLIFYGAEALQVWEMLEARSLNLAALNKAREAIAAMPTH